MAPVQTERKKKSSSLSKK